MSAAVDVLLAERGKVEKVIGRLTEANTSAQAHAKKIAADLAAEQGRLADIDTALDKIGYVPPPAPPSDAGAVPAPAAAPAEPTTKS